jgi:hypothetical protein
MAGRRMFSVVFGFRMIRARRAPLARLFFRGWGLPSFPDPVDKHRGYLIDGEDDRRKNEPIDVKFQDEKDDKGGDASQGQKNARGEEERRDSPIQNEIPSSETS